MTVTAIETLRENVGKLGEGDQRFARSLLHQAAVRGISLKQYEWVKKLAERATSSAPVVRQQTDIGDLSGVLKLFDKAGEKLKRPAIVLAVRGVGDVRISVAGDRAKVPGSLTVAQPHYGGDWYGRVLRDGRFEASRIGAAAPELVEALQAFAREPEKLAAEHGHLTGRCCFCNQGLSDERSTAVGYGSTCAKNYGLAWGSPRRDAAPLIKTGK